MQSRRNTIKQALSAVIIYGLLSTPTLSATKGGSIVSVLLSDPKGLVLAFPSDGQAQLVGSKIYEGLLNYSTELKPEPSLARSWQVAPDGLTYTFKLQPNVKWSDGTPFSSADVVFTLGKMLPEVNPNARQALAEVQSIEAPDGETVVIRLKKAVPYFLMVFPRQQMPIMPKHIYEGTDYVRNSANAKPIGTGPFKLEEWRRGSFIRLVRNENYWNKDLPYLASITYRIFPDAASRAIALETGDIQIATSLDLSAADIDRFRANKDYRTTSQGWEYFSTMDMLEINLRKPILNDVRFRRALYHAVDRNFILDRIWHGIGRVAGGPVSSKIPFFSSNLPRYDFDLGKTKVLLEEMGFRADSSGARFDNSGNRLEISVLILPGDERYRRLAEYLREAWEAAGIKVNLQSSDLAGWEDRIKNWNYDIAMTSLGQFADPALGIRRYHHSSNIKKGAMFSNTSGYSNPEVDKWFDEANSELDTKRRADLYARIQRKLMEDVAMIWLLESERLTIHHKSVVNVIADGFGPRGPWDRAYLEE